MQFVVLNSMSSRCWEQGVKRKLERQDRKRIVYLSGQRLLPTRPSTCLQRPFYRNRKNYGNWKERTDCGPM